jgi:hypothetical protein
MYQVKFNDRYKRVYPPCEVKSKHHGTSRKLETAEFSDIPEAIQFYSKKFREYHPETISKIRKSIK